MHTHISKDDRVIIAAGLRHGDSQREIAARIGKSTSAVSREIRRNTDADGVYQARSAQRKAMQRRKDAKYPARKIENDPALASRIEERLHPLVSPEVIAHDEAVSPETIYAWIARSRPDLAAQLPQRGKKRRRYGSKREEKQGWTRLVRPIDERPETIEAWEGDTIRGSTRARLLTHVERTSLYTLVDLLPDGTADAVQGTMKRYAQLRGSTITYDRGSEFALWRMIERDTGATTYFAHPHAPWQRGKNENTNGRLRRVYPKRADFRTVSKQHLNRTVWLMNHTKRKTLDWRTPCMVYGKCCVSS